VTIGALVVLSIFSWTVIVTKARQLYLAAKLTRKFMTAYDATGNPIAPGAIRTDATADFAQYFAGSSLGGVFLLRAEFPVTGNSALVASCETTLVNSAGSSKTQRTSF